MSEWRGQDFLGFLAIRKECQKLIPHFVLGVKWVAEAEELNPGLTL